MKISIYLLHAQTLLIQTMAVCAIIAIKLGLDYIDPQIGRGLHPMIAGGAVVVFMSYPYLMIGRNEELRK